MKMLSLLPILFLCWSCADKPTYAADQDFENYSLTLSNESYTFDFGTGEFRIPAANFRDTIILSPTEKAQIAESFFLQRIDTLKGEKYILPKHNVILPDSRYIIKIFFEERHVSELHISTQIIDSSDLTQFENSIHKFHQRLNVVLNANPNYKKCIDTLVKSYKRIPPLI